MLEILIAQTDEICLTLCFFLPSEGDEHGGHVFVDTIVQRSLFQLGCIEGDEYDSHVPQCDII